MLKLSIKNPDTQVTETYDLVTEFNQFYDKATEYGLLSSIFSLKVKDMKAEDAPIRLYADSDVGNGLLRILSDNDCRTEFSKNCKRQAYNSNLRNKPRMKRKKSTMAKTKALSLKCRR